MGLWFKLSLDFPRCRLARRSGASRSKSLTVYPAVRPFIKQENRTSYSLSFNAPCQTLKPKPTDRLDIADSIITVLQLTHLLVLLQRDLGQAGL
jgi:hypothetical protein